ncbi:hypothetical protein Taro_048868, partial [Colocasia esculenta]|nr:hypothetical protein [Colocasia esculenta]
RMDQLKSAVECIIRMHQLKSAVEYISRLMQWEPVCSRMWHSTAAVESIKTFDFSFPRWNKPGHMKGECPKNKKEKYKKINKFNKPKAMVATWSDEDPSENEKEKSSSSESEEICFMANSFDGKVGTSFEDYTIDDWQDAYAELVENYSET